jgi:F0F1-type ATP synthase gamma subunit
MENIWGIKTSRIALPEEKLSYNEWVNELKVSSNYRSNATDNADFLNNQYNFSLIKNRQNESTNNGA